jgi:hypothetical protein
MAAISTLLRSDLCGRNPAKRVLVGGHCFGERPKTPLFLGSLRKREIDPPAQRSHATFLNRFVRGLNQFRIDCYSQTLLAHTNMLIEV